MTRPRDLILDLEERSPQLLFRGRIDQEVCIQRMYQGACDKIVRTEALEGGAERRRESVSLAFEIELHVVGERGCTSCVLNVFLESLM